MRNDLLEGFLSNSNILYSVIDAIADIAANEVLEIQGPEKRSKKKRSALEARCIKLRSA